MVAPVITAGEPTGRSTFGTGTIWACLKTADSPIATKSHFHRDNYDLFSDQPIVSDVGCFSSLRNKNFGEWNCSTATWTAAFFLSDSLTLW